jgi:hypothetical protein
MGLLERLSTGQVASVERPTLAEAGAIGWGGVAAAARATGMNDH